DDQVLVHDRRRAEPIAARQALQNLGRVQVNNAVITEFLVRFSGGCADRKQISFAAAEHNLRGGLGIPGPVFETARRGLPASQGINPELLTRGWVQRDDAAVRGSSIHHAIDDKWRARTPSKPGVQTWLHVVNPRALQPGDVPGRDPPERRESHPARIVPICGPLRRFRIWGKCQARARQNEERDYEFHCAIARGVMSALLKPSAHLSASKYIR